jgi:hypothetical protein
VVQQLAQVEDEVIDPTFGTRRRFQRSGGGRHCHCPPSGRRRLL